MSSHPTERSDTARTDPSRPIFIFGILPRSGTNFLHRLICLHPDCVAARPWEDFLVHPAPLLDAYAHAVTAEWHPQTAERLAGQIDDPPAELLRCIGNGLRGLLAGPQPPSARIVSKTPWVRNLDAVFRLFPDAQLLLLVRDGRAVVESGARSFWWDYRSAMRQWAGAAQAILDFQAAHRQAGERFRLVRYEDLHLRTESTMADILRFLGLDADRYDSSAARNCPVIGSSEAMQAGAGLAHAEQRDARFAPLERWRCWGEDKHAAFNAIAGATMRALGYELSGPGASCSPALPVVPSVDVDPPDVDPRERHRARVRRLLDGYLDELGEPIAVRGHIEPTLDCERRRPAGPVEPSGRWSPLVSVILPAYNMAADLPRAIDGILAQTWGHLELILIDDGSSDETPTIIDDYARRDARVRAFRNPTNRGLIATLNRGLDLAEGELIARQDADNQSFPQRIETQVRYLEAHPDVGLVATRVYVVDDPSQTLSEHILPATFVPTALMQWELLFNNCFSHDTVVMRRAVVAAAGGYRAERLHAEDYDLWSRIGRTAWIALLPDVLATWYRNPGGVGARHQQTQWRTARAIARDGMAELIGPTLTPAQAGRVIDLWHGNPLPSPAALDAAAGLLERLQARYLAEVELTPAEADLIAAQIAARTAAARARLLSAQLMPAPATAPRSA